jgi:hypothetical protein
MYDMAVLVSGPDTLYLRNVMLSTSPAHAASSEIRTRRVRLQPERARRLEKLGNACLGSWRRLH